MGKYSLNQFRISLLKAYYAASNRAAKTAVTQTSIFIRGKYNLKKNDLDSHFRIITRASSSNSYSIVRITRTKVGLIHFKAKQIGRAGRPKRGKGPRFNEGVIAEVQKGKSQLFRSSNNKAGSFIQTIKGKSQVFIRTNEKSSSGLFRIKKLTGLDLVQLFEPASGNSKAVEMMKDVYYKEFEKRMDHEIIRRFK